MRHQPLWGHHLRPGAGVVPDPDESAQHIGEVGLAGEIRKVSGVSRRLAEAYRLGFKRALVPAGSDVKIDGMEIVEVSRLDQALQRVKITGD
jgi:DNA repair protein RadA/Sms